MINNIFRNARLLAAKRKKSFSDATMAAYALGISPTTLYRIERGEIAATPCDVANMIIKYESTSLGDDYCAGCPVLLENRNLENNNSSSDVQKSEEYIIDE